MANQRAKDKRYVGAWIPSRLNAQLIAAARELGIAKSDLVKELLEQATGTSPNSPKVDSASAVGLQESVGRVRRNKRGSAG